MKYQMKHVDLTKQIRDYLNLMGIFHWKQWQGPMSRPLGVSDLIGCYKGRFFAIEIKLPGKDLTSDQFCFLENLRTAGGIGFKATCLEDVIEGLGLVGLEF